MGLNHAADHTGAQIAVLIVWDEVGGRHLPVTWAGCSKPGSTSAVIEVTDVAGLLEMSSSQETVRGRRIN